MGHYSDLIEGRRETDRQRLIKTITNRLEELNYEEIELISKITMVPSQYVTFFNVLSKHK